ncbi:hypothetical protein RFI_21585, partial [Reticulomyxa filosa]
VCSSWKSAVIRFYGNTKLLDLSEFYGVIGSPQFDEKNFFGVFLPRFHAVSELSLRYCTHLKASHLDRVHSLYFYLFILVALAPDSDEKKKDKSRRTPRKLKKDNREKPNKNLTSINLYFCSRLGSNALWKIQIRAPNLQELNIGRCHAITANKDINGLKALVKLPLRKLTIVCFVAKKKKKTTITMFKLFIVLQSLDPSIDKEKAMEVVSLLIHEDSFRELKELDLSHGCEVLGELDLSDLHDERNIKVIKPKNIPRQERSSTDANTDDDVED